MALHFAVLAALLVPAASLSLIKSTSELKQFGQASYGSALHPEQTARLFSSVQDTWRTEAQRTDVESLTTFPKSCSTVASAALMGSNGDHDRVQEYMDNVCKQSVLDKWHQTTCNQFKAALGKSMVFNHLGNRMNFNFANFCSGFWKEFSAEESASRKKLAEQEAADKEAKEFIEKKKKEQAADPNPLLEGAMKMEGAMTKTVEKAKETAEQAHTKISETAEQANTQISKEAASVVGNLKQKQELKEAKAHSAELQKQKYAKEQKEWMATEEYKVAVEMIHKEQAQLKEVAAKNKLAAEKAKKDKEENKFKKDPEILYAEKAAEAAKNKNGVAEVVKVKDQSHVGQVEDLVGKKEQIKVMEAKLDTLLKKKMDRQHEQKKKKTEAEKKKLEEAADEAVEKEEDDAEQDSVHQFVSMIYSAQHKVGKQPLQTWQKAEAMMREQGQQIDERGHAQQSTISNEERKRFLQREKDAIAASDWGETPEDGDVNLPR